MLPSWMFSEPTEWPTGPNASRAQGRTSEAQKGQELPGHTRWYLPEPEAPGSGPQGRNWGQGGCNRVLPTSDGCCMRLATRGQPWWKPGPRREGHYLEKLPGLEPLITRIVEEGSICKPQVCRQAARGTTRNDIPFIPSMSQSQPAPSPPQVELPEGRAGERRWGALS